jgi:hypothetical protein
VAVAVAVAVAQAQAQAQATANPAAVSGTWTGTLGNDGDRATKAVIELAVNGRAVTGVVSGPQLTTGDIRTGTFDPQSGALKFSVFLRGNDTRIDFDGAIAKDTLKVRATGDGDGYILRATRTSDVTVRSVLPATPTDPAAAAVQRSFAEVSGWVTAAANLVPPDRYGYRPTQSVRTFGQMVAHIADAYGYYCGRAGGTDVGWSDATEKGATDKATVVSRLRQSLATCDAAYAGKSQIGPLVENVAHTSLHYGNLVTYMRMLGLSPPSS